MTIEAILVKRRALYPQEVGLFPSNPMAEEDFAVLTMGEEVVCTISSPKNIKALRYLWALVHKIKDNTDYWTDRYKAMDYFLLRVGHAKMVLDPKTKKLEAKPKSLKLTSNEDLRMVTDQVIDLACREIIVGMKPNDLRKEIEEMVAS